MTNLINSLDRLSRLLEIKFLLWEILAIRTLIGVLSLIIIAVHSGDDHVADDHVADDHDHDVEPVIIIPFLSIDGDALLFTIVTFLSIGGDAPAPRGEHPREARVRAVLPAVGGGRGGG